MILTTYNLITDKRKVNKLESVNLMSPVDITGDGNVTISGTMREKCDFINPVFLIQADPARIHGCNYIYVDDLYRYYFVQNKIAVNDSLFEFHCHEDVLTTYRTQIYASDALVSRRQTNARPYIADPLRQLSSKPQYTVLYDTTASHDYFDPRNNNGNAKLSMVGIMATDPGIGGSASYTSSSQVVFPGVAYSPYDMQSIAYAFTHDGASAFFAEFYNANFSQFMNSLWGITSDGIIDFISYPFDLTGSGLFSGTNPQTIHIMNKTLTVTANRLVANPVRRFTFDSFVRVPSGFLDYEPYTRASLYLPYVGTVDLPMVHLQAGEGVSVDYMVDILSGDAQVIVKNNSHYVKTLTAHIGIHVPVTKTNNVEQARNALLSVTGGALGMVNAKTDAGTLVALGDTLVKTGLNTSTMTGALPASELARFLQYTPYVLIESTQDQSATDYGKYIGYPFNENVTLSTLAGEFVKIDKIYNNAIFNTMLFDEFTEMERLLKDGVIL